ncbi:MAG: FAD-dependent pyridine nucleotide-disulfide oxidoreductase, partial [Candidatus Frackibacter sp. T328-2]
MLILDYVIIGNSAAGIGAVEGIRRVDREGKITIISDEEYSAYSRPLISYYLADKVTQEEMKYRPDEFYNQNNVDAKLGIKVTEVNEDDKKVLLEDDEEVTYDKLLVATGGAPFIPEMKGVNKENISNFIKLDDAKAIASDIKESEAEEVVILGAGLIGLKAAEALIKKGLKVTVVELADRVLSAILDKEAADLVQEHLEEAGINFILEDTIIEFLGDEKVTGVKLKSGQELDCDLAVVAVGVKPNVSIVKGTNVEVNRGLVVNDKLETNIDDIYAAGDVSEGYDMLHEMAGVIPIWPNAYNQGLVAGQNMAGSNESYREGFARNA